MTMLKSSWKLSLSTLLEEMYLATFHHWLQMTFSTKFFDSVLQVQHLILLVFESKIICIV